MERIEQMAAEMGARVEDLTHFIACLSVWTSKGHSLEEAIRLHAQAMQTLLERVDDGLSNSISAHRPAALALKEKLAHAVWDEVNGVAA